MKAIMVMFDTLNRRMLAPYGNNWTKTPNFDRLATKSITFDNCYAGSLPCMPARRELHTGRLNFLHRSWGPIEPYDDSMPEILKNNGVHSHLISDHQHYWEDGGCTYHTRYSNWEIERGQEGDPWKAKLSSLPEVPHLGRYSKQDEINRSIMNDEEKQSQTRCFSDGLDFLNTNYNEDNWFLQIETFDPHEPFYTQQHYKDLYPHGYTGPRFDWPDYAKVEESNSEVEHARYEYAALLSMCDANLGKILDFMDAHNMWEDTMLIVNTDHGFLLGEHDCWAKCIHPFYNEIVHIPLFIWDPRSKKSGERRQSLVQTIDLAPTILKFFDISPTNDMQGFDLDNVIRHDSKVREACLFGMHGGQVNVTDGRYVYMRGHNKTNTPLYNYTHMPTHMRKMFSIDELKTTKLHPPFSFTKGCPIMQIENVIDPNSDLVSISSIETMLFDLETDQEQNNPIQDTNIEKRMILLIKSLMIENDSPKEQFERLGL